MPSKDHDARTSSRKPRFVKDYPVKTYKRGLKAEDELRLKEDLPITDSRQREVKAHLQGEIWQVLRGTPGVVWLQQPSGKMHTWDDDHSIYETFELIASNKLSSRGKPRRSAQRSKAKKREQNC